MLEPPYHRVLDRPVLGDDGLLTDDSRTMLEERGWDGIGRNPPKDDLLNETNADRRERLARAKVRKVRGWRRSCQPLPDTTVFAPQTSPLRSAADLKANGGPKL